MRVLRRKRDKKERVEEAPAQQTATDACSPSLHNDERGVVMVEYIVIVGTVMLGLAAALAALGPEVLGAYERTRTMLYAPFP